MSFFLSAGLLDIAPDFSVSISSTNEPIDEGETLDVNYNVENVGDGDGIQDIWLEIDSVEEDRDSDIELSSGETATGTLNWITESGETGSYTATVYSEDDSDSVSVEVQSATPDSEGTHQWDFDEGSGSTAGDNIGNLDGALEGPSWDFGAGIGDYTLEFDGNDYISLGSDSKTDLNHFTEEGEGTVAIWVHPDTTLDRKILLGGQFAAAERHIVFGIKDGSVLLRHDQADGSDASFTLEGGGVDSDRWQLLAATMDGDTARIYDIDEDGNINQVDSTGFSITNSGDWTTNARLGSPSSGGNTPRRFDGGMDVPVIDDTAWSEAKLQEWHDETESYYE